MSWPRTWLASCALLAALLLPTAVAGQAAHDPFAQRHAELLRAAEAQLEQLRAQPATPAIERTAPEAGVAENSNPGTNAALSIAPERLQRAGKRLRAVGVDAARIFAEEGVPAQLLVVAEVESGFDPAALSPKGARGLWQLMPETARRFGLRVDRQVDERLHPARATRAAARYLRELYLQFGDWQLALAAYNAGEQRVMNGIARSGSRDFVRLVSLLPEETRRYVPAVLGTTN